VSHGNERTQRPGALPWRDGPDDRYLLRGLIWCAVCDRLMVPALTSASVRHYGCPDRECPRPLIPAEKVENLVWDHFVYLNQTTADQIAPGSRREAIRQVLARVWVGKEMHDLYYDWRD
jgi:hypothetical protein